jgi:hypothetical protein
MAAPVEASLFHRLRRAVAVVDTDEIELDADHTPLRFGVHPFGIEARPSQAAASALERPVYVDCVEKLDFSRP